jgi:hypothetical protein
VLSKFLVAEEILAGEHRSSAIQIPERDICSVLMLHE